MIYKVDDFFVLEQIAESGQCFRWKKVDDNHYHILANNDVLDIKQYQNELTLNCSTNNFYDYWYDYLDLSTDYKSIIENIDPKDTFLTKAARTSKGIRILKQDKFETLISFIISQQKQIPHIKKTIDNISILRGELLDKKYDYYSFPTLDSLSQITEEELDSLKLGYRKKYIKNTLDQLNNNLDQFNTSSDLKDKELLSYLKEFSGVGEKVANCTMLYGYHRLDAFPVDTWINKVLKNEYNYAFDLNRYRPFNGVLQQYMFYTYRK